MADLPPNSSPPPHPTHIIAPTQSPNPWADTLPTKPSSPKPITEVPAQELELTAPPPSAFDDTILPSTPSKIRVDSSLLNEFDPLADKVEVNARDAWASSEGHPPAPPPVPPPKGPNLINKALEAKHAHVRRPSTVMDPPTSAAAHVTTFATLASLARTSFGRRSRASSAAQHPNDAPPAAAPASPAPVRAPTLSVVAATPDIPPTPTRDERQGGDSSKAEPTFDFQKFLDQMKSKSAEPVAKYLRSFLNNFAKRNFTVNDQIKLIRDFLEFIYGKMRECDVWKHASDSEFDNAVEAMEKLVMNRLYDYTFTPQIDQSAHPVTTDDLERDHVLRQRMKLFEWVEEKHLDVPVGEGSQGFLNFAQQELLKINHYKAPRDKVICILNCCKVIFGLIRHLSKDEGADSFIPILIFVVLRANPEHLISNIEYINRFRSPSQLQSESGYYLSSLTGAVSFIETMDHTSLSNITQAEFESNVEAAIQALPSSPAPTDRNEDPAKFTTPTTPLRSPGFPSPLPSSHTGEEPAIPLKLPSATTIAEDTKRFLQRTGDSISKPLNAIGKILGEAMDGLDEIERQREVSRQREQEQQGTAEANGGGLAPSGSSIFSQMGPDWLFGGSGPGSSRPQTPAGGGPPPGPGSGGPNQTPYRPRIRPGSAGGSREGTPATPTATNNHRHSSYQIPALSFGGGTSPLSVSRSLPRDMDSPQPQRPPMAALDPRTQQQFASEMPGSRAGSPLDLTALQNEIDRAHTQATVAARETLLQMFPGCDPEVVDMVLEANRGDLGSSIESMLDIVAT